MLLLAEHHLFQEVLIPWADDVSLLLWTSIRALNDSNCWYLSSQLSCQFCFFQSRDLYLGENSFSSQWFGPLQPHQLIPKQRPVLWGSYSFHYISLIVERLQKLPLKVWLAGARAASSLKWSQVQEHWDCVQHFAKTAFWKCFFHSCSELATRPPSWSCTTSPGW